MLLDNIEKIFIWCLRFYIRLRILKYSDQTDIIIVSWQIRLHILKIAHVNRHIIRIHMAVSIDPAPLSGQINAGDFSRLP